MNVMILTPAYGRDYKSKAAAVNDLEAGKDFIVQPHGSYINLPQLRELGVVSVNVRYGGLRKVAVIKLQKLASMMGGGVRRDGRC